MFGAFMSILDQTIVNIALPHLQSTFGTDLSSVQWVLTAYTLTQGVVTPTTAYFVARLGTKYFYILGLALFLVGSVLCGLATSLPLLIVFRILQAVGGASLFPLATTMLYNEFPLNQRGMASGLLAIAALLGPAIGPSLGGYFVAYMNWQWIFFINIPIGLLGIVLALFLLRKGNPGSTTHFDSPGFLLAAAGLASVLYGLSATQGFGWGSVQVLTTLIGGLLLLVGFVLVEWSRAHRHKQPLVDVRLFTNRPFLISSIANVLITFAFFGGLFIFPLYLQNLRGMNAFQAGLFLLPQAGASLVMALIGGRLVDRFGVRAVMLPGLLLLVLASWQMTALSLSTDYTWLQVLFILRGMALGLIVQPLTVSALSAVPPQQTAQATTLFSVIRFVSTSLGIAVLATLVQTQTAAHLREQAGLAASPLAHAQSFVQGIQDAFWFTLPVLLASIVAVCFVNTRKSAQPHAASPDEKLQEAQLSKEAASLE
jgi:DHA2 family multidrug resistance protein